MSIPLIGDVANSKRPLLIIPKVQLRLRVTRRSWQKLFASKNFVTILVAAQTQLRSYSEQQRALEIATSAIAINSLLRDPADELICII